MDGFSNWQDPDNLNSLKLKRLSIEQIRKIDDFLCAVGEYGDVTLVVENGRLKYINTTESHKAQTSETPTIKRKA